MNQLYIYLYHSLLDYFSIQIITEYWSEFSVLYDRPLLGIYFICSVQLLSRVRLFVTPWTAARQASLSLTNSQSFLKLMPKKRKSVAVLPSIFHEVMGPEAMILVFWMLSFKPPFSLSSFTFIKRFFGSSLVSDIRVLSSAHLRLLIFFPSNFDCLDILLSQFSTSLLFHVCCFLTCIQISQEAGKVVWYKHLDSLWLNGVEFMSSKEDDLASRSRFSLITQELLHSRVLLKWKGDRESFWHRHQEGDGESPIH